MGKDASVRKLQNIPAVTVPLTARLLTLVAPLMDDCCGKVPNGLITVDTARFNLLGDLLKLKALLTFLPVLVANLECRKLLPKLF